MESEEKGFDAGEFYDEGIEQAGIKEEEIVDESPSEQEASGVVSQQTNEETQTESETQTEETDQQETSDKDDSKEDIQAVLESTEEVSEAETEPESVIEGILPKVPAETEQIQPEQQQRVPLEDHIKLRQRAQAAEKERDELKAKMEETQTGGEKPGEKSPLKKFVEENPDEDFIPASVQLAQQEWLDEREQAKIDAQQKAEQAERDKAEAQQRAVNTIKALGDRSLKTEAEVRKANPDYDEVTKPFVSAKLLKDSELAEIFKSENPSKKLYDICKAKADAIRSLSGSSTNTPGNKTTKKASTTSKEETSSEELNPEDELTDDQIFEEVWGKEE